MNIQVDPTSSNLASAMLNSKIRPRAVVGYALKFFFLSSELRHQITWLLLSVVADDKDGDELRFEKFNLNSYKSSHLSIKAKPKI